jgi:hypothetical protein
LLTTSELGGTTIERLLLGRDSGNHQSEAKDRAHKQIDEHGNFLQKKSVGNPLSLRENARSSTSGGRQEVRPAKTPSHGANQQRQTHWRRCKGGPSPMSQSDGVPSQTEGRTGSSSQTGIGRTTVGATDCCTRLACNAASR